MLQRFRKDLSHGAKGNAFEILLKAMEHLIQTLDHTLGGETSELTSAVKSEWSTRMKMLTYLFCQMIEMLEAEDTAGSELLVGKGGRGAKKSASSVKERAAGSWTWDMEPKRAAVVLFYRLVNLNLSLLFDPPIVEDDFIKMIARSLFRLLETPTIAHVKNKDLKVSLLQVKKPKSRC